MVHEIAELHAKHLEFIQNKDNFKGILKNPDNPANRREVAVYISPYYKKLTAYQEEMYNIFGRNKIDADLKKHYVRKKAGIELENGMSNKEVVDAIRQAFDGEVEKKRNELFSDRGLEMESMKKGAKAVLSVEELEALYEKSNSVSIKIMEEHRSNKPWLDAGRDVSMESLKRMNNLHEQFKNEDSMFYINSDEYTDLKNSLKAAADMYKAVNDVNRSKHEMSSEEKIKMEAAFDAISDAALKYIKGKEEKARKSDHGQNRYEIAFAALGISSEGAFNEKIELHNIKHILRDSKTLSLEELMERGDRTVKQQKDYEKIHKPREKQKERRSSLASI